MAKKHDIDYEFDPVKYETNGKNAEKVVWTTKALEKAVEALNAGLPLKANPFIGKVTQLLKPDLVYRRTPEEIEDYIRCKQDPVYFAEKCFLMTPEGLQKCKMRDYQVEYLHHLQEHRFSVRLSWAGVSMFSYPVKVNYPEHGISNFRMLHDNIDAVVCPPLII